MKTRIMTTIVLIGILIPVVYFGGTAWNALVVFLCGASVFEMLSICNRPRANIYLYPLLFLFMIYSVFVPKGIIIDMSAVLILLIVLYSCSMIDYGMDVLRLGYYFTTAVLIAAGLHSLYFLRVHYGFDYLIMIALATFGTDTGAYFAGMCFGKHKLNPRLSPKKTIEGSLGGMLLGTVLSVIFGAYTQINMPFIYLVAVCFVLTITGQVGDLTFSSMKRKFEVKDFSQLLPGHGGILDRFDAFLFNGTVLSVLLYFIEMVI